MTSSRINPVDAGSLSRASSDTVSPAPLVMKFGGTSVQDAPSMCDVVRVVAWEQERSGAERIVVVTSACAGITDLLLRTARAAGAGSGEEARACVASITERHCSILAELGAPGNADASNLLDATLWELAQLAEGVLLVGELTPRTLDRFASFGELLSSILLTAAFAGRGHRCCRADSRTAIITNRRYTEAAPLSEEIARRAPDVFLPLFGDAEIVVAQGFIGSTLDGETTTIGRGGSDYTAALLGAALDAPEIQIWTDVSGILTTDPRLVPAARTVPEVTFGEARELARFGAKVLHPDTILPAVERSIPVVVRNTKRQEDAGTRILPDSAEIGRGAHAIALKRGLVRARFSAGRQFSTALARLAEHGVEPLVAHLVDGGGTMLLEAADSTVRLILESSGATAFEPGIALLCVVGPDLPHDPVTLSRALSSLPHVVSVTAGHSRYGLLLTLPDAEALSGLAALHTVLFEADGSSPC